MCNSSLVVHNDRLFAFGGLVRTVTQDKSQPLTPIGDVLEYTPGTDTWVLLTSMPTPCHSSCLASLGELIRVITAGDDALRRSLNMRKPFVDKLGPPRSGPIWTPRVLNLE
uniref:Kelch repeat protein n=1 Tax=Ixodes ricinus TaxID=34613 RepID=A0A6B0UJI4_IXORI